MENELRYQVRSREIVDLYSAMRRARLVIHAYFQRNLVWRDAHRRDFIETIQKGFPFPQIFLARGPINLETMEAQQCIVDGQQRLNAIKDYIEDKLDVNGKRFSDLTPREKESFLKYEVAVIDFDLESDDARLKEIFHRLNRTYYSLSAIERLASEYSASEFLIVARALCGELSVIAEEDVDDLHTSDDLEFSTETSQFNRDPAISEESWLWLLENNDGPYKQILQARQIFSKFEFDRKVPLMFTLNLMCTHISGAYYNRNDKVRKFLEDHVNDFPEKETTVNVLNTSARYISSLELPENCMWWSKANFFTLMAEFSRDGQYLQIPTAMVKDKLLGFERTLPETYSLAAREATSRKSQREQRALALRTLLL